METNSTTSAASTTSPTSAKSTRALSEAQKEFLCKIAMLMHSDRQGKHFSPYDLVTLCDKHGLRYNGSRLWFWPIMTTMKTLMDTSDDGSCGGYRFLSGNSEQGMVTYWVETEAETTTTVTVSGSDHSPTVTTTV